MDYEIIQALLIPFSGTLFGAASVFFMNNKLNKEIERALSGFAAGVMVAASFFSLIIPALELSSGYGNMRFIPVIIGFWIGIGFLLVLDEIVPHIHADGKEEGISATQMKKSTKMLLAVGLHNLPEGMAVGILYAGYRSGDTAISISAALALAIGIAIQNFPEGAIISIPLRQEGCSKIKAFAFGALSGAVEPVGAIVAIALTSFIFPAIPYTLSFAAGAMLYVVIEELIPEMADGKHSNTGTVMFSIGFSLMLILDILLG